MEHTLRISVSKEPADGGIVSCRNVSVREHLVYDAVSGFRQTLSGKKETELDKWLEETDSLEIDELSSFINGIRRDIAAVKNAILLDYNNGLAEGSVNKLKVVKRIMYGRNSFEMLKGKSSLHLYFSLHFICLSFHASQNNTKSADKLIK